MKKLIPTKFYYNSQGLDKDNRIISYGNGIIDTKEIEYSNISDLCLDKLRKANFNVVYINLITLTPLEFDIIEEERS